MRFELPGEVQGHGPGVGGCELEEAGDLAPRETPGQVQPGRVGQVHQALGLHRAYRRGVGREAALETRGGSETELPGGVEPDRQEGVETTPVGHRQLGPGRHRSPQGAVVQAQVALHRAANGRRPDR